MFRNLEAEMVRYGVTKKDIAKLLNVRYGTVIDKFNGKYPFKLIEAIKIKQEFFQNLEFEYLFEPYKEKLRI